MNFTKFSQYAGGLACVVLFQAPALAADPSPADASLCAVSGFNAKLEAAGGYYKGNNGINKGGRLHGAGSVALPLSCVFGLQLDGAIGALDGKTTGGVAVHAFTRDPSSYLFGGYGEYSVVGKNDIWRFGGEAEAYWGQITFSALAGYENSDLTKGDLFAAVDLSFYATDNFKISGGYRRFLDINAGAVGAEWQFDNTPISLFTEGQIGSKKHLSIIGGFRYHFGGPQKSLIRRHREDDPFNRLTQLIRRVNQPAAAPVGGGGEGGGTTTNGEGSVGNASDRRLKHDLVELGKLHNGLTLYRFAYNWSDQKYVGVMAQEVLEVMPEAVVLRENGFYAVRYEMLGIEMLRYEDWLAQQDDAIAA